MDQNNNIINKISRALLLPKELIGFTNGLIASLLASILMDVKFSNSTKIVMIIGEALIIVMSIVLIKYRDNYDDNRKTKTKSDAWVSINNNEPANKILGFLPRCGILTIYLATFAVFITSGHFFVSEGKQIKQAQENTIGKISETNSLVDSINSMLRKQVSHADNVKTNLRRIECKIDSLIIMNNQSNKSKDKAQKK